MSKTRDIVDLTFIKSYCKEIDVLKQTGYWSNKAGDFLLLALSNWCKRPVRIHTCDSTYSWACLQYNTTNTSRLHIIAWHCRHDQPIIAIQRTLGSVCNTTPLTLAAYTSSPGFADMANQLLRFNVLFGLFAIQHH